MTTTDSTAFISCLRDSIAQHNMVKLTLSHRRYKSNELKNVFIKPVVLKSGFSLSFVYRYPTKDVTKNYETAEALAAVQHLIEKDFMKADLFTTAQDFFLTVTKSEKYILSKKAAAQTEIPAGEHDHSKKRFVSAENNIYLTELGITTKDGKVKSDKQDKFRQINKYVEIVAAVLQSVELPDGFEVVDMGAGKGYLTFALYDYLTTSLHLKLNMTGVEMREGLVETCNKIAKDACFEKLKFLTGSIEEVELPNTDMLIALHACDIATDLAIYRGITSGAKVIICAPCCHKQIRKQLKPTGDLSAITRFGILEERQAEILTDTIRALILEAFGYKTKVFEFISTEHTPKNVMIVGTKTNELSGAKAEVLERIKSLKDSWGIEQHYLEKLMNI